MLYQRTIEELVESTRYGKLYLVERKHGKNFVCCRVRRQGAQLYKIRGERITIEQTSKTEIDAEVGDFAFLDAGKTWALWKPSKPIEVK